MNPYVLKVGRAGEQRLHLLNETCNAATLSFFHDTVNLEGKSILDIGCGTGILACELALKVGKKGFVNALDISQDQLMLARKNAHLKNISNIILTQLSAHEINLLTDKYDIIYCRFVMTHLRNADSIINKMKSLLHPDGLIIIEEPADIDCMSAYPPSTIFERWKQACFAQVRIQQTDFTIGRKIPHLFKKNNIETIKINTLQPLLTTPHLKQQLWMGIQELKNSLIESNYMNEADVDQLINDLKEFSFNDKVSVGLYQYTQIAGRPYNLILKHLTQDSNEHFFKTCVEIYAKGLYDTKEVLSEATAIEAANKHFTTLLSNGSATLANVIYSIQYLGKSIGYAWYFLKPDTKIARIALLYLDPKYRRNGFARWTLEKLENEIKNKCVNEIELNVFSTNSAAIQLYQTSGYQNDNLVSSGTRYLMRKKI